MARSPSTSSALSIFIVLCLSFATRGGDTGFIEGSCAATGFPDVCVQSLSIYAATIQNNYHQLALTALSVSFSKAQEMKSFVSKLARIENLKQREYKVLIDCEEEIGQSVTQLGKSIEELKNPGDEKSEELLWHMSNVETWVSASLTNDTTCTNGLAGKGLDGQVKSSIKALMVNVAQILSNALALITTFLMCDISDFHSWLRHVITKELILMFH